METNTRDRRLRVKICGVCRPADAAAVVGAGAGYVGVILSPGFGRSQSVGAAASIYGAGDGARRVGVFVDGRVAEVRSVAERLSLDVLQLHGREPVRVARELAAAGPWAVWKVLRPRSAAELGEGLQEYGAVVGGVVLDGWSPASVGGTGTPVPWQAVAAELGAVPAGVDLILAGGLTAENVREAVAWVRPEVVDVSSGVESAPGRKDPAKVRAFVEAAWSASIRRGEEPA